MSTEPESAGTLLSCERLVIGHRGRGLLPPIDLELPRGSFTCIIGRNGSGKSTFFRTLLGFIPPVSGRVSRPSRLRSAYVAQAIALDRILPLRARDVVAWGKLHGWGFARPAARADAEACARALETVGAADLADRAFGELSEGQKQRVLLARMLASDPDLAMLDEPTSAMDVVAEEHTMEHLAAITRTRGMATLVISHVLGLAARHATHLAFFDREAAAVVVGAPADVLAHSAFQRRFGKLEVARGA